MNVFTRAKAADKAIAIGSVTLGASFVIWTLSIASYISLFAIFILLLVAMPYLLLALFTLCMGGNWLSRLLLAASILVCAGWGIRAFDSVDEDAQGALILLFGPIYQIGGVLVVGTLLAMLAGLRQWWRGRKAA